MNSNNPFQADDRGVSNALGFILVFALVIATITLVFTAGTDTVDDLREGEQVANAERAMYVAHQNAEDIHLEGISGRDTEIQLYDSQLTVDGETEFTVTVGGEEAISETSNSIEYEKGDQTVVYEGGALIRTSGENGVVTQDPPMKFDEERTFIPVITTHGDEYIDGHGTPLVVKRLDEAALAAHDEDAQVEIEIIETTPERAEAWDRYFDDEGLTDAGTDVDSGEVRYEYDPDSVVVRHTAIDVWFE